MDLKKVCEQTIDVVKDAALFISDASKNFKQSDVKEKSLNSLVSYVDIESEKLLVKKLSSIIPGATFLTEENTVIQQHSDWVWIIDPLDGTTNFIHHIPAYAVSVALQYKNEMVVAVVHEINRSECFYAYKNGGAFMNDVPIHVNEHTSFANSLVATGFPYEQFDYTDDYLRILKQLMKQSRGIRRLGSAAVDLAYVACGRFDLFFEYNLKAWDVAAGALIVKEAGGIVKDFKNEENYLFGGEIVAGNNFLLKEYFQISKLNKK